MGGCLQPHSFSYLLDNLQYLIPRRMNREHSHFNKALSTCTHILVIYPPPSPRVKPFRWRRNISLYTLILLSFAATLIIIKPYHSTYIFLYLNWVQATATIQIASLSLSTSIYPRDLLLTFHVEQSWWKHIEKWYVFFYIAKADHSMFSFVELIQLLIHCVRLGIITRQGTITHDNNMWINCIW